MVEEKKDDTVKVERRIHEDSEDPQFDVGEIVYTISGLEKEIGFEVHDRVEKDKNLKVIYTSNHPIDRIEAGLYMDGATLHFGDFGHIHLYPETVKALRTAFDEGADYIEQWEKKAAKGEGDFVITPKFNKPKT